MGAALGRCMKSLAIKSSEHSVACASDMGCGSSRPGLLHRILRQTPNRRSGSDSLVSDTRGLTLPDLLRDIRSRDFGGFSDADLRNALVHLKALANHYAPEALLSSVFALVNESIGRRLGAWRFFDPTFDCQGLDEYHRLASEVSESATYQAKVAISNDGFLGQEAFHREIAPLLVSMGLDEDSQVIVCTLLYLREVGTGKYSWNILLPAEFYQTLTRKDTQDGLVLRPTDEQILAGILLFRGRIVEMSAGEGKTIAAAFPAVMHAILGRSVHIITANDYLASRDSNLLAPVYKSLGLNVDAVLGHMWDDERKVAYNQQIVYGTMREFGFDFLRDNLKTSAAERVQSPLQVAIVDEADHALIDEASTPMIISGDAAVNRRQFTRVKNAVTELISLQDEVVRNLEAQLNETAPRTKEVLPLWSKLLLAQPDNDNLRRQLSENPQLYRRIQSNVYPDGSVYPDESLTAELFYAVDPNQRFVTLTGLGQNFLETQLGAFFDAHDLEQELATVTGDQDMALTKRRKVISRITRQLSLRYNVGNQVYQMLRSCLLLKKDVDYLVNEGSILLIDRYTGRPRPDSRYQEGLQPAIEAKEGVSVNSEGEAVAQISVQGFATQYDMLAGMTGTASAAADEFRQNYSLEVEVIPTSRPLVRQDFGCRIYIARSDKLAAIVDEVKRCQRVGRPVLVGTRTVQQSIEISQLLTEHGVTHNLLNAVTCHEEAHIIQSAGAFGAVTVATDMAGRGTDIILEPDLDRQITAEYLQQVRQLLTEGKTQVALQCYTAQEADFLWSVLSASSDFALTRHRKAGYEEIAVTLREPLAMPTRDYGRGHHLDYGLGLYVIGTEVNESPRIDLQLKGRAGRQGQFGWCRVFLSLEDKMLVYHGNSALASPNCKKVDSSGRAYFEGKQVEQQRLRIQENVDRENELGRGLALDYTRIADSHADRYYSIRRDVMEAGSFFGQCHIFAQETGPRIAERYFPNYTFDDYGLQFTRVVEETQEDYAVDCSDLRGVGLDQLGEELSNLLIARLVRFQSQLGPLGFTELARLLLLQTGDELWKEHIAGLQDVALIARLFHEHGHKSAVADCAMQSAQAWDKFQERVTDRFLSRLLTCSLAEVEHPPTAPVAKVKLIEDAALILA